MSEMTPMSTLTERIGALAQLKELKNEIAENLKSCNAQIEQAEKEIIASMLDLADAAGLDDPSGFTVDVAGRRYGIKVKPFYSIRKDQRDEAFAALRAGADCLKLFPAGALGPGYVKDLKAVIKAPIMAVGGVDTANAADFLKVCAGIGVGSALYKPGKPLSAIAEDARRFTASAR